MGFGRQGRFTFGKSVLLIAGVAIGLMSPSLATAEESNIFVNFSKCPTSAPEMNDPAQTPPYACFSALMRSGAIKVGNIALPVTSPAHIQFATTGGGEGDGFLDVVPNGTSLDAAPLFIPNLFAGLPQPPTPAPPTPPTAPAKKHYKKKHHKKKHHKKKHHKRKRHGNHRKGGQKGGKSGNRRIVAFSRARASGSAEPLIAISMELAGDIRNFNLSSALGVKPGISFEIPVRMHLQGDGLGPNCFLGSPSEPIVLAPEQLSTKAPTL